MRHNMNGKCDALRMFGIPNVLEIVEAVNNAELKALGITGTHDMPVNANGFMKYIELDPSNFNIKGEIGKWE